MKAFMYPGQGAQRLGMGRDLFARFPDLAEEADAVLGYDLAALCRDGPMERLTQTAFTQPALFVVNALAHLAHVEDTGETPGFLLGHSVSEYVALFAAGVLEFGPALRLVAERGRLMGEARGGGMAAVLGLEAEAVEDLLRRKGVADVYPANFNTPKQIVVSGKRAAIEAAEPLFLEAGASHYVVLPVGGAFHTPFMAPARERFAATVAATAFAPQRVPVISNVTARPHTDADLKARMVEQITAPVRWCECLRWLLAQGIGFADTVEIGPDGPPVVRPMVKRTEAEAGPLDAAALAAPPSPPDVVLPHPAPPEARAEPEPPQTFTPCAAPEKRLEKLNGAHAPSGPRFTVEALGSRAFCERFGVRHAYVAGAMYRGIASTAVVARMAKAGLLAFFGAAGLPTTETQAAIRHIKSEIPEGAPFGVNFIAHLNRPHLEDELTDVLLAEGVRLVEASAFMEVSPALVRYRAKGLRREGSRVVADNRILAKVSRPEVAAQFLAPAPKAVVDTLRQAGVLDPEEADLLSAVPMADAITVESDSGGHTDQGMPFALIPPVLAQRDAAEARFPDFGPIFVGAGGGIGTPEAAAAMLILGADYLVTGSINQCTVEAGTSDTVKDMLEAMQAQDTAYAPSGEMFEFGSKIQVLKKGVFFPARAEKLVAVYRQYDSLDAIDPKLRDQIQERFLGRSFDAVFSDIAASYGPAEVERAERMPKHRMALIFKRYFRDTSQWAMSGEVARKVDFQVHCGPALGAFNQWVAGSPVAGWRVRHVDEIAQRMLEATADLLNRRTSAMLR